MTQPITQDLNPAQREAVSHGDGPLLVIAGAGSGKTRVLTSRIARLIHEEDVSPFSILAITFTNKAAREMQERVSAMVGTSADKMWVSTFHSACVKILRREAELVGYTSRFSIHDTTDTVSLIKNVLADLGKDPKNWAPKGVRNKISEAKNRGHSPASYQQAAFSYDEQVIAEVFVEYQKRLRQMNTMDFDDLLAVTVELFKTHPEVLERWQNRFTHIFVDEYQDTNSVQNELVMLLGSKSENVCVVGDADQSIYGFRAADIANINDFGDAFGGRVETIVLNQNYRSTQTILEAANAVIANNGGRIAKELWSEAGKGEPIARLHAENDTAEASWVVREIARLQQSEHYSWSDIAVFYRANWLSRQVEDHLVKAGISYRVYSGPRFYDRAEVKDALAYLRAVVNPADEISIRRVVNKPPRGIGPQTIAEIDHLANTETLSFYDALSSAEDTGVKPKPLRGINEFLEVLIKSREMIAEGSVGPAELLEHLINESGYRAWLEGSKDADALRKLDNLGELLNAARDFGDIDEFLEQVALATDQDSQSHESSVTLMTMHAAKGLEFPVVFMIGLENGVFPDQRDAGNLAKLEEERRLCYVGITRAKERLYLTSAVRRRRFDSNQYNVPSRFINEIPETHIREVAGSTTVGARRSSSSISSLQQRRQTRSAYRTSAHNYRDSSDTDSRGVTGFGGATGSSQELKGTALFSQPKKRSKAASGKEDIKVGDDIIHTSWGEGVVLDISGQGDNAEILIRFPSEGEKRLVLEYAPIKRL